MSGCITCRLTAGDEALPGGRISNTDHWVIEHCIGPLGVGTLILKPMRRCTGLADLDVDEAAELGPSLNKVSSAVTEITCADQVYSCLWSHSESGPRHIHFVLQPVRNDQRASYGKGGPFIQTAMFEANEDHDPIAVEEFCDRARDWFAAHS